MVGWLTGNSYPRVIRQLKMETIKDFLINTPVYVYLILSYLLFIGIKSTKKRIVSFFRAIILVIFFIYLSINNILKFSINSLDFIPLGLSLLVFSSISWKLTSLQKIKVDKEKQLFSLPGTWTNLIVLLLIFTTKYYIGYQKHLNVFYFENAHLKHFTILSSGFSLGFSLGRILNYIYRFRTQDHVALTKN